MEFIEVIASKSSLAKRVPLFGVGINDAEYKVKYGTGKDRITCPYYARWQSMIMRCHSKKYHVKNPTYIGCTVIAEWLVFSVFKEWMEGYQWEGLSLDKDLLVQGNKVYSPETCLFISHYDNSSAPLIKTYKLISPRGVGVTVSNMNEFCKVNNLNQGNMSMMIQGQSCRP